MPYPRSGIYRGSIKRCANRRLDLQGPLVDYKTKGNTVEYLGKENSQGLEYYKLKANPC